jgi:peptidyl-prolyl cis-trans isomerase D
MLQRIREGIHGPIAWVILGLIALTFVFWGGSGALDFSSMNANVAASVDGEDVPAQEATRAWSDAQARWAQQVGSDMPPEQRQRMQASIIDRLIFEKLLENRLREQNYRVSDQAVLAYWATLPAFQVDGKFDRSRAAIALQSAGMTEQEFAAETRKELLSGQLERGIGASYFLTPAEKQRLLNLENEEREVQYVQLPVDKFIGNEPIEDAAIQAYYDKNADRFMTAESADLDFAELRLEQLSSQVAPTEADLRKAYEDSRALYVTPETRRARHIVIGVEEGQDDATALKKAEAVVAEARAGKDFAELAKKNSTDTTAAQGGELGFVQKADFPGPIGDTLFSMKAGEVSAPVKSQYGYHILKLEEIQAEQARPFEEVRAELDSQYRTNKSSELFGDRQEQIASLLEQGVTDLDKVARDLGLTRGSVSNFLRGGGAEPLGSSPELQQVVFSDETLNQGKIGGPVALGDDRLVLIKVRTHHKSVVKPLADVREEIVGLLRQERGVAAAKAAAEGALKRLEGGEKIEDVAKSLGLAAEPARFVSRGDPSMPAALRTAVFEAPRPDKPVSRLATLDDGSSALYVLTRSRVADAAGNPALADQQTEGLLRRSAQGDLAAYMNEAKRKAKIVKNPGVFSE